MQLLASPLRECTLCKATFRAETTFTFIVVQLKGIQLEGRLCSSCTPVLADRLLEFGALRCSQHRMLGGYCEACGEEDTLLDGSTKALGVTP